ncbi:MAG: TRAM domain-containing protein [Cyanophyceae cyanobacterium]
MKLQQPISLKRNQAQVGKGIDVLVEQEKPLGNLALGRCDRFSPEVDGLVYVATNQPVILGSIIPVEITEANPYDLRGRWVNS